MTSMSTCLTYSGVGLQTTTFETYGNTPLHASHLLVDLLERDFVPFDLNLPLHLFLGHRPGQLQPLLHDAPHTYGSVEVKRARRIRIVM